MVGRAVVLLAAVALAGCGSGVSQRELDEAADAVRVGLEAWKAGDRAASLKAKAPPLEFTDESWAKGDRLLEFQLLRTEGQAGLPLRCTAALKVRDRVGKTVDKEVVYEVRLGNPVVIARDPYY
jgi:hypothetical protein